MKCAYCGYELDYCESGYIVDGEVVCADCVFDEQFNDLSIEDLKKCSFINKEKGDEKLW